MPINNLIGQDIELMRNRYDEALELQGIPCKYQFPNLVKSNDQGEPEIDSYSDFIDTFIFFDGSPKMKTFKRYGWVVENDSNLPFLIHCSFHLHNLQKDSLFRISGQYTNMPDRLFRVTELTCDLQAPDHMICQIVPEYEKLPVRRTEKETSMKFNKSNTFLKQNTDYRGNYHSTREDGVII